MTILGLLETDTLYDDLAADYGSYGHMFAHFFDHLNGGLQYRYYDVQKGELPQHIGECDAYLITGSKAAAYDALPWILELRKWIADFHQQGARLIGICFGHQIISHSLGGIAAKSNKGWGVGVHSTSIILNSDDRSPNSDTGNVEAMISLLYSHQDQVQKLPPQAQLIASSNFCEYAAFKIDNRVLSFQGHPEFTPEYLQRLLQRRIKAIGENRYNEAMASLHQTTDEAQVGRLLLAFIHNGGRSGQSVTNSPE
ncbi:MAG: GMP synthase [Gammaproteobacteria bacterium]|nr:MAG: GMP synthase [Gammaproteobacteria bacterium]